MAHLDPPLDQAILDALEAVAATQLRRTLIVPPHIEDRARELVAQFSMEQLVTVVANNWIPADTAYLADPQVPLTLAGRRVAVPIDDALRDFIGGEPTATPSALAWISRRLRDIVPPPAPSVDNLPALVDWISGARGRLASISFNPALPGTMFPGVVRAAAEQARAAAAEQATTPASPTAAGPLPCPCGCGIDWSAMPGNPYPAGGEFAIAPEGETAAERFTRFPFDATFTPASPAARYWPARAPSTPPSGDVLADIDAAVEERCACGCGQPITDASPSAWFASAACQSRWNQQHATNPSEVYASEDAAIVWLDDAANWRPDLATTEPRRLEPVDASLGILLRRAPTDPSRRHRHRGYAFGWDPAAHGYVLRLDDGHRYVEMVVDEGAMDAWFGNWDTGAVADAWGRLDRQLADARLTDQQPVPAGFDWSLTTSHEPMPRCRSNITWQPRRGGAVDVHVYRDPPRAPRYDAPRDGYTLTPFAGGPMHRSVLAIPDARPNAWCIAAPNHGGIAMYSEPPPADITVGNIHLETTVYGRRPVLLADHLPPEWLDHFGWLPAEVDVYAAPDSDRTALAEALESYVTSEWMRREGA